MVIVLTKIYCILAWSHHNHQKLKEGKPKQRVKSDYLIYTPKTEVTIFRLLTLSSFLVLWFIPAIFVPQMSFIPSRPPVPEIKNNSTKNNKWDIVVIYQNKNTLWHPCKGSYVAAETPSWCAFSSSFSYS